ncbi:MAG: Lon-like protease helical domain-containing protein, partial [Phycisphaerae bacterium]
MPTRKKSSKPRAAVTDGLTPLPPRALRWHCDHAALSFDSTADVDPAAGIVGQEAAVDALRFGVEATAPGQHIFIRGLSGTGRLTLALRLLRDIQPVCTQTQDRCYVHSFTQHDRPALITLPAGEGRKFRRRVEKLADFIRDDLKAALSSEGITARKAALERATSAKLKEVVAPFERSLEEAGLTHVGVQADPGVQTAIFPLV